MALSTQDVLKLSQQEPLSTQQVQNLASPSAPTVQPVVQPASQTITASALTSSQPLTPEVEKSVPPAVVSPYVADITPEEKQAETDYSAGMSRTADLMAQLDPSFIKQSTKDNQAKFGVQQIETALRPFENKATQLQDEAKGIELQRQQIIEQNRAQGGSSFQLSANDQATNRSFNQQQLTNAISQYTNNSSIATLRGNLADAMSFADKAVEAEFLPKEQQLAREEANLKKLQASGLLTSAQEKRAAARQAQIDEQKAANADAKKLKQDTSDARIKAISNNTGNPNFDSTAMAAINAAQSPEEVAAIMQYLGLSTLSEQDRLQQSNSDRSFNASQFNADRSQANADRTFNESQRQFNVQQSATTKDILSPTEAQTLGVPYGTTKSQAAGMGVTPSKPPTAAQEVTALYANRLEQSGKIMDALDNYVATTNPLTYSAQSKLPDVANALKSADFQSVEQAQRNFVNATLRRESGAVISPSEFDNARKQYFPLPGDKPETVAQKKANRDLLIQGFISGSGSAYAPIENNDPLGLGI